MNKEILEKMKAILSNPAEMDSAKLKSFMEEALEYFQLLQKKATSSDLKEREEAIQEALELKAGLEEQMNSLSKVVGMSQEQLMQLASNAQRLNPEEKKALEEAQKKLFAAKGQAAAPFKPAFA